MAFLKFDGFQLMDVSEKFRDDREVVWAAITQDGASLRYASERFKNDKEIVLKALAHITYRKFDIEKCIGEELRNDEAAFQHCDKLYFP